MFSFYKRTCCSHLKQKIRQRGKIKLVLLNFGWLNAHSGNARTWLEKQKMARWRHTITSSYRFFLIGVCSFITWLQGILSYLNEFVSFYLILFFFLILIIFLFFESCEGKWVFQFWTFSFDGSVTDDVVPVGFARVRDIESAFGAIGLHFWPAVSTSTLIIIVQQLGLCTFTRRKSNLFFLIFFFFFRNCVYRVVCFVIHSRFSCVPE